MNEGLNHLFILSFTQSILHSFQSMPGIYIHIPYCKQACHYCDFHFSTVMKSKDNFVNALLKEIELQKDYFALQTPDSKLQTLYFGGGTPSLLSGEELKRIISQIKSF